MRAQQQERGVDGIHRVVPDDGGQDAVADHDPREQDAAGADLHAANEPGLVRVGRVAEAPQVGGRDDRHPQRAEPLLEQRNRQHAEPELFGNGREESAEQDEHPGEFRVEQRVVVDVGRCPGSEVVRDEIEDRLVGEEEGRQRQAEHDADEEALAPHAAAGEPARERDLTGKALAIEGLGDAGEQHQRDADAQRGGDGSDELAGEERRVGLGRVVPEAGAGQRVEAREQAQHRAGAADPASRPPPDVADADPLRQHDQHAEHQDQEQAGVDVAGGVVLGAHRGEVARPLIRNLEVLVVAGDLVTVDADLVAVLGLGGVAGGAGHERRPVLPREDVVGAMGPFVPLGLGRLESRHVEVHDAGQEPFGELAGRVLGQAGAGRLVGLCVRERDDLAGGRDVDVDLFLGQRAEPAMLPPPQPDASAQQRLGPRQAEFAFEKGPRAVVVAELLGVHVARGREAAGLEELFGEGERPGGRDLEVNRRLGERPPKVVRGDPERGGRHRRGNRQHAPVPRRQPYACLRRHDRLRSMLFRNGAA